jgi:NADH-quinone oxidoreductase subunit L
MFRLVFGIFFGSYRGNGPLAHGHGDEEVAEAGAGHGGFYAIYESPAIMTVPLLILAVLSVIGGLVGSYALFGRPAIAPFEHFLSPLFTNQAWTSVAVPDMPLGLGLAWISSGASLGLAALGILVAWIKYRRGFAYRESRNPLYLLSLRKYYVDELCTALLITPLQWLGRTAGAFLEDGLLSGGGRGIARVAGGISLGLRRLQTGYMRNYALAVLFGVVLLLIYYVVMRG